MTKGAVELTARVTTVRPNPVTPFVSIVARVPELSVTTKPPPPVNVEYPISRLSVLNCGVKVIDPLLDAGMLKKKPPRHRVIDVDSVHAPEKTTSGL
jgi:hypothetical protein